MTQKKSSIKSRKKYLAKAIETSIAIGDIEALKQYAKEALEFDPKNKDYLYNLGVCYFRTHHFDESRLYYTRALKLDPNDVSILIGLTKLEIEAKIIQNALIHIEAAFLIAPHNLEVLRTYGSIFLHSGELEQALIFYQKAFDLHPHDPKTLSNLGIYFLYTGNLEKSNEYLTLALNFDPKEKNTLMNLAQISLMRGRYFESIDWAQKMLFYYPNDLHAHQHLSVMYLGLFELEKGWEEYNLRDVHYYNPEILHGFPDDLTGKRLFIRHEQGLGDELFFLRFLPLLKQRGAWIAYMPHPKLYTLLQTCEYIDLLVQKDDLINNIHYSFFVADLPKLLSINSIDLIPSSLPLPIANDNVIFLRKEYEHLEGPFIGITWRAGVQKLGYLSKEIPLIELIPSLQSLNSTIVVLQRNPSEDELRLLKDAFGDRLIDASHYNEDLEKMLALLSLLDTYIAVSNTNIHLAGSIDKRCHILIPFPSEWRWGYQGNAISPWYRSFKLYRQNSYQAPWKEELIQLVDNVHNELFQQTDVSHQMNILNESIEKIEELINYKMYQEAELLCETILTIDDTNFATLIHLANIFNATQQYEKLLLVMDKIQQLQSSS